MEQTGVEEYRAIRRNIYFATKDMTPEEAKEYISKGADECEKQIEEYLKSKTVLKN